MDNYRKLQILNFCVIEIYYFAREIFVSNNFRTIDRLSVCMCFREIDFIPGIMYENMSTMPDLR